MTITSPRRRFWGWLLLAAGVVVAGSVWWSRHLTPTERQLVGMWIDPPEENSQFSRRISEFRADHTVVEGIFVGQQMIWMDEDAVTFRTSPGQLVFSTRAAVHFYIHDSRWQRARIWAKSVFALRERSTSDILSLTEKKLVIQPTTAGSIPRHMIRLEDPVLIEECARMFSKLD